VSRFTDLIALAKAKDPQMGTDLEREFKALSSRLPFGLNFERHRPEAVELPQRPIRKGDRVRILPERGSTEKGDQRLWYVKAVRKAKKIADLELLGAKTREAKSATLDDLVFVAEFRDTIYPGLVGTGTVKHGSDKPFHTVINGENYHVLKALTWTHRGKVDAIYIDPPYNTGARDWKYNNDYVESDDLYRHSKWLAMMERRLLIAKDLLNPADSVLIVTIDEKEYLRLGLLLEQTFPQARIQMISSVISQKGSARIGEFSRCDEFIYFVMFGKAAPLPLDDDMLHETVTSEGDEVEWGRLKRNGANGRRDRSANLFYPIFLNKNGSFHSTGDPIPRGQPRDSIKAPKNTVAVFPVLSGGQEMSWGLSREKLEDYVPKGFVKFGAIQPNKHQKAMIYYLTSGYVEAAERGEITMVGSLTNPKWVHQHSKGMRPMTVWAKVSHDAGWHGSRLLDRFIPGRKFPFPKSLFAVEDALRFFVAKKPESIILDFFAGSGTTAHAVMRLNKQDSGRRQCISVTNNEVAADEEAELRARDLRPGDAEWEKHGICDFITKPRVKAAINGKTPAGEPIEGDYKFTDEFPMAEGLQENAEFFTLTYESPVAVSYQMAFARIAALLWLRAGSRGRRIEKLPTKGWEVADTYGLLIDVDSATDFLKEVRQAIELRIAYIVTDDDRRFQALARRLPEGIEAVRLYESYLTNFSFINGD